MHRERAPLPKSELFERLAQGHAARFTVVTPNRRLAHALARDFDRAQAASGLAAWETADILPFNAFVERLWEDALYSDAGATVPMLLAPAQEQALWEESIRATGLVASPFSASAAAGQCREAWRLAHAWRVLPRRDGAMNDDARAFLEWSSRYERATRERCQVDAARLPDVVASLLADAALRKPASLALFGFDLPTPQMREFFDALSAHGCTLHESAPAARRSNVARVALAEPKDEIKAAARWARSRLETAGTGHSSKADVPCPLPRIGVVVPDLARSRALVQRLFADVMQPGHLLPGTNAWLPFNVSLGGALAQFPLVADALIALALAGPEVAFEEASRLVRSPFLAGAQAEMAARARLDARLRERCGPAVTLEALLRHFAAASAPRAPVLVDRLSRLAEFRKASLFGAKSPAAWARAFSDALRIVGLPGERALDSAEHQTFAKWHELLGEFAALERVIAKMGYVEACQRLAGMAGDALFQPEAAEVPVQIVGVLESAGLEFDHLWVMGLTDEAWPMPARPDPFIPIGLQRAARIPQADPVSSLELDRRITEGWMRSSGEVVLSHARMKGESELAPSPLIAAVPESTLEAIEIGEHHTLRDAMRATGRVETIDDARAPAIAAGSVAGGTGLFRDQAACPFRAFARRRLQSKRLETPRPGLDARDRGTLVHTMLAAVWKSLENKERLDSAGPAQLEALLATCADAAIADMKRRRSDALSGRFAQLERERLVQLAHEWLALESQRDDFEVVALEDKRPVTFGGVTVDARLDRMDRLAAGGYAVLDYKAGVCATAAWMGARPDEPQLPMYALGGGEDVAAVAFAQLKAGEMGFKGIGRAADLLPGVRLVTRDQSRAAKQYRDWAALVEGWSGELEALGRSFAAGDARVDPKRGALTCANCDQPMFCRIAEKAPFGAVGGDVDE